MNYITRAAHTNLNLYKNTHYCESQILSSEHIDDQDIFKGEQANLAEMVGNLLDNARSQLIIKASFFCKKR